MTKKAKATELKRTELDQVSGGVAGTMGDEPAMVKNADPRRLKTDEKDATDSFASDGGLGTTR